MMTTSTKNGHDVIDIGIKEEDLIHKNVKTTTMTITIMTDMRMSEENILVTLDHDVIVVVDVHIKKKKE